MRGMLLTDPRPLATAYKGKLTVVQGDNDVQVTVDKDAKPLAAAHPGAKLVVLKDVGHMLKHETGQGAGSAELSRSERCRSSRAGRCGRRPSARLALSRRRARAWRRRR